MKKCLVFGEALYDVYPTHKKIGGAPLNFGAHFAALGGESYLFSAVGRDELGQELLSEIASLGVNTSLVEALHGVPSAYCKVSYESGEPIYNLPMGVSYDFIREKSSLGSYDLFYFGTLAARSETSRNTLRATLKSVSAKVRFFDLNLRQSFYTEELIRELLGYATVLKLNRDEYEYCNKMLGIGAKSAADFSREISERFDLSLVIVTLDKDGSAAYERKSGKFISLPIKKGKFVSAVGAGDSFSACFMYNYLSGASLDLCMERATALASLVVGAEVAVPCYDGKNFI